MRCGIGHQYGLESVLLKMSSVHCKMTSEFIRTSESLGAVWPGADMWLLSRVCAHVGLQVVRSREFPFTHIALERSHSGVLSAVASQLV